MRNIGLFKITTTAFFMLNLLSSCATQKPAEIVYGTSVWNVEEYKKDTKKTEDLYGKVEKSDFKVNVQKVVVGEELDKESGVRNLEDVEKEYLRRRAIALEDSQSRTVQLEDRDFAEESKNLVSKKHDAPKEKEIIITSDKEDKKEEEKEKITPKSEDADISEEIDDLLKESDSSKLPDRNQDNNDKISQEKHEEAKHDSETKKELDQKDSSKFLMPVKKGIIISKFGEKIDGAKNSGINISSELGQEVFASESGQVIFSNFEENFGNLVIIKHDIDELFTAYAHMQSVNVKKGQYVVRGDVLGKVGKTGRVNSPQLHFAVRKGKKPQDPELYLK